MGWQAIMPARLKEKKGMSKDEEEITKNSKDLYRNHEEEDNFSSKFINGNWEISTPLIENQSINVVVLSSMDENKN